LLRGTKTHAVFLVLSFCLRLPTPRDWFVTISPSLFDSRRAIDPLPTSHDHTAAGPGRFLRPTPFLSHFIPNTGCTMLFCTLFARPVQDLLHKKNLHRHLLSFFCHFKKVSLRRHPFSFWNFLSATLKKPECSAFSQIIPII